MAHRDLSRNRIGSDDRTVRHDGPDSSHAGAADLVGLAVEDGLKSLSSERVFTPRLKKARALYLRRARLKKRLAEIERRNRLMEESARRDAEKRAWRLALVMIVMGLIAMAIDSL